MSIASPLPSPSPTPTPPSSPDVGNVHFVHQVGNNFLFRGAEPLYQVDGQWHFNLSGLQRALTHAARDEAKIELPPGYLIIDINLMQWSNDDEVFKILCERDFFANNSQYGEFHFWNTDGTELCALSEPLCQPKVQTYLASNLDGWLGDQLVKRVEQLHAWLSWPSQVPLVIYLHCHGGDDRTGEWAGAYYMRWMNMTWCEAYDLDKRFAGEAIGCNNYRALQWYAMYLAYHLKFDVSPDVALPCNNAGTVEQVCG